MIANAQDHKPLPIYGDGMQERDWLFVEDYCRAIVLALEKVKRARFTMFRRTLSPI